MDSPTQALLGAVIGQAGFERTLGRRAIWWGALAGSLPDADIVFVVTHGRMGEFLYHRGPTHSLWFGLVVGPVLGWCLWKWYQRDGNSDAGSLRAWIGLMTIAIFTHPLLDVFTIYGTQLFSPFSNHRFGINGVAITDPFYSSILIAALLAGYRWRKREHIGSRVAYAGLVLTCLYLAFGLHLNSRAESEARRQLTAMGHANAEVRAYPTLLQPFLRRIVARTSDEAYVGMLSTLHPDAAEWQSFEPEVDPRIEQLLKTREGEVFTWFAMGQLASRVVENDNGALVEIEDLRYGYPGPPDEGIWGMRAEFNAEGTMEGSVEFFERIPPIPVTEILRLLWVKTFLPAAAASP